MKRLEKSLEIKYWSAYDLAKGVLITGETDPGLVTDTGLQFIDSFDTEDKRTKDLEKSPRKLNLLPDNEESVTISGYYKKDGKVISKGFKERDNKHNKSLKKKGE